MNMFSRTTLLLIRYLPTANGSCKISSSNYYVLLKNQTRKDMGIFSMNMNLLMAKLFTRNCTLTTIRGLRRKTQVTSASDENELVTLTDSATMQKPNRAPHRVIKQSTVNENNESFIVSNVSGGQKEQNASSEQQTKTARDLALDIRARKGNAKSSQHNEDVVALDPKKRALQALIMPNPTHLNDEDLAKLIRRHVIYADKKLVIFNKPYGIAMHDGDGISQCIKNVLPILSKMIYGINTGVPLNICNRLDKYTTGLCVCTTDKEITSHMQKMFREHKVLKKYWAVTVGVPDPSFGVIDIPMDRAIVDTEINGSYARMVVKPDVRFDSLTGKDIKVRVRGHLSVTHFKVLDFSSNVALVELQPQTTIKHQLRVHLADGLACPILGDHKYSNYSKIAPQSLPPNILSRYGIAHSKSRHMPLHLHLQGLVIPGVFPDQQKSNLMIGAKVPFHLSRTMRMFGLKPGAPTEWKDSHVQTSTARTAKPRDEYNELYNDPTEAHFRKDVIAKTDFNKHCVKVFRNNTVKVKYNYK